jgi:hypothetical protein
MHFTPPPSPPDIWLYRVPHNNINLAFAGLDIQDNPENRNLLFIIIGYITQILLSYP